MIFKVMALFEGFDHFIDLPLDMNLQLLEACERADIYKRRRPEVVFQVVNQETGDYEYQV